MSGPPAWRDPWTWFGAALGVVLSVLIIGAWVVLTAR